MIPKIIHYCWLSGDAYPPDIARFLETWKEHLPDYEFVKWDKEKFDINNMIWVKEAYESKKYAFAADYIRFYALYHNGGIYLDSDVEVLKSFDPFLQHKSFCGHEAMGWLEPAVIGAEKGTVWLKDMMDYYENRHFIKKDKLDDKVLPIVMHEVLNAKYNMNNKLTEAERDAAIELTTYPYEYFSPKDHYTAEIHGTENTFAIHHFNNSWVKRTIRFRFSKSVHKYLKLIFGEKTHDNIANFARRFKKESITTAHKLEF